jgi:predicted Ser/Thr protein kinase
VRHLQYEDIIFERELGEGPYSKVFKANWKGFGVAVKVPKDDDPRLVTLLREEGVIHSYALSAKEPCYCADDAML